MISKIVAEQPEAPRPAVNELPHDLAEARDRAILQAFDESSALAEMLRGRIDSDSLEFLLRGALLRIEALCLAGRLLLKTEHKETVREEYFVVFGDSLEASNV